MTSLALRLLFINVSTLDFHNEVFCESIFKMMATHQIKPSWFALEVTETAFEPKREASVASLAKLSNAGVSITLDDFGTGYTALSQLIHYPIDSIKIDKSFTDLLLSEKEEGEALIRSIISIAREYKLKITAEGVEHLEQFYFLEREGCDLIQGYLYSEPLSLDDLAKGIRNQEILVDPSIKN